MKIADYLREDTIEIKKKMDSTNVLLSLTNNKVPKDKRLAKKYLEKSKRDLNKVKISINHISNILK